MPVRKDEQGRLTLPNECAYDALNVPRSRVLRRLPAQSFLPVVLGLLLAPMGSQAANVEVDSQIVGQLYELRTADAGSSDLRLVDRRRLTTYLGLHVSGLGQKDEDGLPAWRNQFAVHFQMRFDADFGDYLCAIGRSSYGSALGCLGRDKGGKSLSPELSNYKPEILEGYIEGQSLGGWVDMRLGRQIQWDLFDLRGFDGLWVQARTPIYVAAEAFGGLAQNGTLPIDSPLYALDGTARSVNPSVGDDQQQTEAYQPTVGFALRSYGLRDVQTRLAYRRTFSATKNLAPAGCQQSVGQTGNECAPGFGTIEERLAYSLHGRFLQGRLQGFGGFRYDFVSGKLDDGHAGLRASPQNGHFVLAEYRYSAPTFDGDSIFNVFSSQPYHDVRLAYDGRLRGGHDEHGNRRFGDFAVHAHAFARMFQSTEHVAIRGLGPLTAAFGGSAGVRWQRDHGQIRLDAYGDGGYGGLRAGSDLAGRLLVLRNRLGFEGRLLYMYFADDQKPDNRSHMLGMQLGARWAIINGLLLHIIAENNIDRYYNSQLRLMAMLDLSYLLGPNGGGIPPAGLLQMGLGSYPPLGPQAGVLR